MFKQFRRLLIVLLLIAGMCFLYLAYAEHKPYAEAKAKIETVKEVVIQEDDSDDPMNRKIDFEVLQGTNPDIVGWLYIPQIALDTPILQGVNDSMYLYTDFEGAYSPLGAVFTWAHASKNLSDSHICLFGHKTSDGQMFGRLQELQDQEEAPIYLYTPYRTKELSIVSSYECHMTDDVFQDGWNGEESETQVVTLATCTSYDVTPYRFVVNCEVVCERVIL